MTDASPTNVADLFDMPIDADEDLAVEEENANEENSNTIEDDVDAVPQQIAVLQPAEGRKEKKLRCHPAQMKFIKEVRDLIDAGTSDNCDMHKQQSFICPNNVP